MKFDSRAFHAWSAPLAACLALAAMPCQGADRQHVYIGAYTRGSSRGIYHATLDLATGRLSVPTLAAEATDPSFLNIHPQGKFLYAVSREGDPRGGVLAFAIDGASGKLTSLGRQASCGDGPCYVAVGREGKSLVVASYSGGFVAALPIQPDGSLSDATALVRHASPPANPADGRRQSHAHSINIDRQNRFAVAADLGLDELRLYRFNNGASRLTPNDPPSIAMAPGSGPRHFAFHPLAPFAYANMELSNQVVAFAYDAELGRLQTLQTLSTLPGDFHGANSTAEIQIHPNGRFLYVSNRGHNSLAAFAVDAESGRLKPLFHQLTAGQTPRNFTIDPTGQFLLVANQDSNNVVVFRIDPETGGLRPTGESVELSAPVCVKFAPAESPSSQ